MKYASMRMFWKRHMISNIIGVVFICVIVGIYISLLRYNKASTTSFNLVPKSVGAFPASYRYKYQKGGLGPIFHFSNQGKKPIKPGRLPVYIVEEHHEVLPVWFEAAKNGYIPQHGNTLIHLDGHSDMAPPFFLSRYPAWRPPKDSKELHTMMQRNDAFIVEAAMAGLIRKVIWIWPKWTEHEHEGTEQSGEVEVGWAQVDGPHRDKFKVFCLCYHNSTENGRSCIYLPLQRATESGVSINPHLCHVKKSFFYKEIREDIAVQKLSKGKLVSSTESVLLDIDEDYYGCAYASKPLLDANMSMDNIHKLDGLIQKLFCPQGAIKEQEADRLLVSVLGILRKAPSCPNSTNTKASNVLLSKGPTGQSQSHGGKFSFNKSMLDVGKSANKKNPNSNNVKCKVDSLALYKEAESAIKKYLWQAKNSVACGRRTPHSEKILKELMNHFKQHSQRQLRSLQYVGFCLTSSPKSSKLVSKFNFHVCHGVNYPGHSAVHVYIPDMSEIHQRTKLLQDIMSAVKSKKTSMATVCRSIRDGYTPRRYFNRIEGDVLKVLNVTFGNIQLRYDSDLLGGRKGWPSRHKVSPK
ncbi:uncharacterized protein LOC110463923 [Mizuhopecten yessoensis]|uniref:UPF0489 protein C5orf22-like n=1 Tax=Mizuhopecten yessoensis TaxID=6573 RepID=A0A210PV42_MIZYE|nr:uncharacterized protein LOC110463923 [Mizuhopecten yessoensis]OWF40353.1 UPF0489 protein C5orf22-like [Mizuhopecten yessoensis]